MRKFAILAFAMIGFVGTWLGLPADVEPSGRSPAWLAGRTVVDSISVRSAQAEEVQKAAPANSAPAESADACLPRSALDDITNRRKTLEKRESELAAREGDLATREKAVQEELKKIQAIRAEVEKVQGAKSSENDEKVTRTVEVLESMNPKAASQLIASYEEKLAVQVMGKMSTPKLSKILNVMDTKKSARLMELMAGGGTPAAAADGTVPNTNAVKK